MRFCPTGKSVILTRAKYISDPSQLISVVFKTTDTRFDEQVKVICENQPDVVLVSGLTKDGGLLIKQLREADCFKDKKVTIIGGNGLNTTKLFNYCEEFCEGILIAQAYNFNNESSINNSFKSAFGQEPTQSSAQLFTAIQVIVESLKKIDSIALPKTPLTTHSSPTPILTILFHRNSHNK